MVVVMMCRQDVENGVIDYLRGCGERVECYDITLL